jgi:hypothetical protein
MHDVVVVDGKDRLFGIYHLNGRGELGPWTRNRAGKQGQDAMLTQELAFTLRCYFATAKTVPWRCMR